jgi:hypothetical protein
MPRAQAGLASAVATTSRQIGVSMGVAMAGALVGGKHDWGAGSWDAFPAATHVVWWIMAAIGVLVLLLGFAATGAWARASTERVAHLLEEAPAEAAA